MCLCIVSPNCVGTTAFTIFRVFVHCVTELYRNNKFYNIPTAASSTGVVPSCHSHFPTGSNLAFIPSTTGAPELSSSGDLHRRVGELLCFVSIKIHLNDKIRYHLVGRLSYQPVIDEKKKSECVRDFTWTLHKPNGDPTPLAQSSQSPKQKKRLVLYQLISTSR